MYLLVGISSYTSFLTSSSSFGRVWVRCKGCEVMSVLVAWREGYASDLLFLLLNMSIGTDTLMKSIRRTEKGTRTERAIVRSEDGTVGEDGTASSAGNWRWEVPTFITLLILISHSLKCMCTCIISYVCYQCVQYQTTYCTLLHFPAWVQMVQPLRSPPEQLEI